MRALRALRALERSRNVTGAAVVLAAATAATGLAACAPAPNGSTAQGEAQEQSPAPSETAAPTAAGLEETDFGSLPWVFRPGGNLPETVQLEFVDGSATDGMVTYTLGETVHAQLTDDDRMDAAVQVTRLDGNALDEQWYLWVADDDGPVQVTLPVARASRCGTVTHSVTAAEGGGVQIHETRRTIGEDALPCTETGTDERTRVVTAMEARNAGEWWPVRTDPAGGFGGLCPVAAEYEAVPYSGELHPVPNETVGAEITGGAEVGAFPVEPWPVYGEPFPGWILIGVQQDGVLGCAWAETP